MAAGLTVNTTHVSRCRLFVSKASSCLPRWEATQFNNNLYPWWFHCLQMATSCLQASRSAKILEKTKDFYLFSPRMRALMIFKRPETLPASEHRRRWGLNELRREGEKVGWRVCTPRRLPSTSVIRLSGPIPSHCPPLHLHLAPLHLLHALLLPVVENQ